MSKSYPSRYLSLSYSALNFWKCCLQLLSSLSPTFQPLLTPSLQWIYSPKGQQWSLMLNPLDTLLCKYNELSTLTFTLPTPSQKQCTLFLWLLRNLSLLGFLLPLAISSICIFFYGTLNIWVLFSFPFLFHLVFLGEFTNFQDFRIQRAEGFHNLQDYLLAELQNLYSV